MLKSWRRGRGPSALLDNQSSGTKAITRNVLSNGKSCGDGRGERQADTSGDYPLNALFSGWLGTRRASPNSRPVNPVLHFPGISNCQYRLFKTGSSQPVRILFKIAQRFGRLLRQDGIRCGVPDHGGGSQVRILIQPASTCLRIVN